MAFLSACQPTLHTNPLAMKNILTTNIGRLRLIGLLFLLFIINALQVGIEQRWQFATTTWKVLLACIIPFGTFYVDRKILQHLPSQKST